HHLLLRPAPGAALPPPRDVERDHHVQLAPGAGGGRARRTPPRRDVPVDPPDVVALAVRLVLIEVEAGAALRADVLADAQVANALRGVDLDVPQLAHDVLGNHGIGTARSSSLRM